MGQQEEINSKLVSYLLDLKVSTEYRTYNWIAKELDLPRNTVASKLNVIKFFTGKEQGKRDKEN